jgi:hypothetical protein
VRKGETLSHDANDSERLGANNRGLWGITLLPDRGHSRAGDNRVSQKSSYRYQPGQSVLRDLTEIARKTRLLVHSSAGIYWIVSLPTAASALEYRSSICLR